jgi:uncharacterized protein (DUF302 family)
MFYIKDSDTSFGQATSDFEEAVKNHSLDVLHIHDLGAILRSKGFAGIAIEVEKNKIKMADETI